MAEGRESDAMCSTFVTTPPCPADTSSSRSPAWRRISKQTTTCPFMKAIQLCVVKSPSRAAWTGKTTPDHAHRFRDVRSATCAILKESCTKSVSPRYTGLPSSQAVSLSRISGLDGTPGRRCRPRKARRPRRSSWYHRNQPPPEENDPWTTLRKTTRATARSTSISTKSYG